MLSHFRLETALVTHLLIKFLPIFYIPVPIFLENFNSDFSSMTLSQIPTWGVLMDLVYLAGIGLFFALMLALAAGCARLGGAK